MVFLLELQDLILEAYLEKPMTVLLFRVLLGPIEINPKNNDNIRIYMFA